MADVGEVCAVCPHLSGKVECLAHHEMRMVVGLKAQGVDHQRVYPFDVFHLFVPDGFHVGDVEQRADAEPQYGQFVVHHGYGHDVQFVDGQHAVRGDGVEVYARHARIKMLLKTIGHHLSQVAGGTVVGIDVDFAKRAEGAYVVHAAHMVVVGMGYKHTVDFSEGLLQHLLSEVGPAVDKHPCASGLHHSRCPRAPVVPVAACAYGACAADGGHAYGCACA